jgi:hypothetical protein
MNNSPDSLEQKPGYVLELPEEAADFRDAAETMGLDVDKLLAWIAKDAGMEAPMAEGVSPHH